MITQETIFLYDEHCIEEEYYVMPTRNMVIRNVLLNALLANSRFEKHSPGDEYFFSMTWILEKIIKDSSLGQHTIHANDKELELNAYHFTWFEWLKIKSLIKMTNNELRESEDNYEDIRYNWAFFGGNEGIYIPICNMNGHEISTQTFIKENYYMEDPDTYGLSTGTQATKSYVIYVQDTNEYVVVSSFWWSM